MSAIRCRRTGEGIAMSLNPGTCVCKSEKDCCLASKDFYKDALHDHADDMHDTITSLTRRVEELTRERDEARAQCEGLAKAALNNGQALLLFERALEQIKALEEHDDLDGIDDAIRIAERALAYRAPELDLSPRSKLSAARAEADKAGWTQAKLRHLVDVVWNECTDSEEVPATDWADRLIARALGTYTPPQAQAPDEDLVQKESKSRLDAAQATSDRSSTAAQRSHSVSEGERPAPSTLAADPKGMLTRHSASPRGEPSPDTLDQLTWTLCPYIREWADAEAPLSLPVCDRCPAEFMTKRGRVTKGCRVNAQVAARAVLHLFGAAIEERPSIALGESLNVTCDSEQDTTPTAGKEGGLEDVR